jgi:hypothetical protein
MSAAELALVVYGLGSLADVLSSLGLGRGQQDVREGNAVWAREDGTFRWLPNVLTTLVAAPFAALFPILGWCVGVLRGLVAIRNVQLRRRVARERSPEALRRRWREQELRNGWQLPEADAEADEPDA